MGFGGWLRVWAPHRNVLRGRRLGFAPAVPLPPLGAGGGGHLSEFSIKSIWFVGKPREEEGKREKKGGQERWKRKFVERQRGRERMAITGGSFVSANVTFRQTRKIRRPSLALQGRKVVHEKFRISPL